jgi:radical SAM superfamily enzyme YgiQ (UPF0313 family)
MFNTPSGPLAPTHAIPSPPTSSKGRSILLLRPPYFTPWTPPLGIAILKSFLNEHGHRARCFDFNADPELWGMHHRYFSALASTGGGTHDGYSKLWWIINAHMLAYANGAGPAAQRRVIEAVSPLYGVHVGRTAMETLLGLIDRYFTRLSHVFDQVDLTGYDVIGTSTYTTSLSSSLWVLQRAKRARPAITTVMGGGVFADDLATGSENLQILLAQYPLVDHVVMGEGELLLQKLLDGELSHKRALVLSDLEGKTLAMGDVPTPDFSDFDMARYYNLTIEGARSCPFQCSFCSETIQWGEYRRKPIDKFVHQVREMVDRAQVREVFLGDSLMNPYLNPFADALIEQNTNIIYDGYLRADKPVTKEKFVERWAESGLYRVRLGIESGSDRVLTAMHKMTTAAVISDVLKTLSRAGIRTTTYWIVGHPGETEEDFEETCDFIRAHHRYIYELEAHPYYYYPYGQVGSRLYQCESTYPEDVTNLTKFKVWEIIGGSPSREVRYQRLERISQLAAELGLPNIYTMTDRYEAEARWRALHASTREVFRDADAVTPDVPPLSAEQLRATQGESEVIAYRLSVAGRLDAGILGRALADIAGHYPMLRGTAAHPVCESDATIGGGEHATVQALRVELEGNGGMPLRVALIRDHRRADAGGEGDGHDEGGAETSTIVLLARRRVVDAASLMLIAETLSRVYEQHAASKATYLRPEGKSYSDYARGHVMAVEHERPDAGHQAQQAIQVPLTGDVAATLSPAAGQRREAHVRCVTAALRVLGRLGIHDVGVLLDPRVVDPVLTHTVGPLSRIVFWPDSDAVHGDIGAAFVAVRTAWDKVSMSHHAAPDGGWQAVINLEYLAEPAWMGKPEWSTEGWTQEARPSPAGAAIQLYPRVTAAGVVVDVLHDHGAGTQATARELARQLEGELRLVAAESDGLRHAERYWNEELGYDDQPGDERPAGPIAFDLHQTSTGAFDTVPIDLPDANRDLRAALVAMYALLAPRLDNLAVPRIALLYANGARLDAVPLRMHDSGDPTCADFIRGAGEKMAVARVHSARTAAVLGRRPRGGFAAHACLMDATSVSLDTLESRTILDMSDDQRPPRLLVRSGLYRRADIESLSATLSSVVTRGLLDPALRIGDVIWDSVQRGDREAPIEVGELSQDFLLGSELS